MTLAKLVIGHCNLTHEEVVLAISGPTNPVDIYCSYAELNKSQDNICCTRQNSAECLVFPNMINQFLFKQQHYNGNGKNAKGNGKRPTQTSNLTDTRNKQDYLSARQNQQNS